MSQFLAVFKFKLEENYYTYILIILNTFGMILMNQTKQKSNKSALTKKELEVLILIYRF